MSDHLPLSVAVELPADVEGIMAAHEAPDEGSVWTTIIHGALWEMRAWAMGCAAANRELHDELREALESVDTGEGVEMTPEWGKRFRARREERHRHIDELQAQGLVGNLVLPAKLYDFVTAEVSAGRFASATDVVSEAVRTCSWHWEREDGRGEQ